MLGGVCTACPFGTTNQSGDDPSGSDTSCDTPVCVANAPAVVYHLTTLSIPTQTQANNGETIGHNVDFAGDVCGVPDYAGGVDNSLIDLAAALPALAPDDPIDLQSAIDAAIACPASGPTCTRLELNVRVTPGVGCASVVIEDEQQVPLGGPFVASVDGAGNLRGVTSEFGFTIPYDTTSGFVDLRVNLTQVTVTGTTAGGTLSNVVIGGLLAQPDFETFLMDVVQVTGGEVTFDDIAPILANLYDVVVGPSCSAMSAGFLAAGAATP